MRNDHGHGAGGGHGHGSANDIGPDLLAQMGYEQRDVSLNNLGKWLIFLWIFIAAMTAVAYGTYQAFVPKYAEQTQASPVLHVQRLPPNPQIQVDPRRDIMEYRQAEDDVISGKAKSPGETMTIAQAMDTIANQQGIAGIRGNAMRPLYTAYPGSGAYNPPPTSYKSDAPLTTQPIEEQPALGAAGE